MTPYYEKGGITIYHGDCLEILPSIKADIVIADPPYNYGMDYGVARDDYTRDEYRDLCGRWFDSMRLTGQRVVVFPGHGNMDVWFAIKRPSAVGCWYKPGNSGSSVAGFVEWEPWMYWAGNKAMLRGSDTIRAPVSNQSFVGSHPCPKPLALIKKLLWKDTGNLVVDPFMGSGTTLVAAACMGRDAIGIEINENYCEIAAKRLSQGEMFQ